MADKILTEVIALLDERIKYHDDLGAKMDKEFLWRSRIACHSAIEALLEFKMILQEAYPQG